MSFKNFGLIPELLRAIDDLEHKTPTPIQEKAIPVILNGIDIIGLAQTGTGKTGSFALPMLQLLHTKQVTNSATKHPRSLILAPTRELCAQIGEHVRKYGNHLTLRSEVVFGGVNITPQIRKLQRGTDIIIATPGRLLDLIEQRVISLSKIEILVLDEADRMLDMGFIRDVNKILGFLPKERQNMLFSATLSTGIQALANNILRNHKVVEVAQRNVTTDSVSQVVYQVDQNRKRELLSYLIGFKNWQQVLVFTRTKHGANKLCEQLTIDGLKSAAIHGNKNQGARTRALEGFKTGKIRVLVATDIAARGIDIEELPYVVNYELPQVAEDYVHRIGRTGRAGKSGTAISLVSVDEARLLADIEKLTKKTLAKKVLPGYEPVLKITNNIRPSRSSNSRSKLSAHRRTGSSLDKNSKYNAKSTTWDKSNKSRFNTSANTSATEDKRRGNWKVNTKPKTGPSAGKKTNNWGSTSKTNSRPFTDKGRGNYRFGSKSKSRSYESNLNIEQS